ncbi:MAG: RNA-processing protein [Candidatus ainarchaeum sp.]|nr:RNA-processing protein [Candidatus ainarchaeum sp.]
MKNNKLMDTNIMDRRDLRKKLIRKTQREIEENLALNEVHIIKAVNIISDLETISNLMAENISDWKKRNPTGESSIMFEELIKNQKSIEEEKDRLTEFIESEMKKELPNFSEIAGSILGAKILSEAGSKKKLMLIPSSTMQLLGASKALFNHLKRRGKCPKHGLIFNHPYLQKLPKNKRGKAARILAGKLSIAVKIDYFGTGNKAKELKKEIEEKISKL